ncbi:MAG: nucleotidyltransferase family protein [Bacteriovoracia bacterium]
MDLIQLFTGTKNFLDLNELHADWYGLAGTAEAYGILLPALARLRGDGSWPATMSESSRQYLEHLYFREKLKFTVILAEHDRVQRALAECGGVALGGVDTARRYYPDPELRGADAIEFLVERESFTRALRALGREGFRVVGKYAEGSGSIQIARRENTPVATLRTRLLGRDFQASDVEGLPVETLLAYCVEQGFSDPRRESLQCLADLDRVIRNGQPDWAVFLAEVARSGVQAASLLALQMLARDWGTPIPADVLEVLESRTPAYRRPLIRQLARTSMLVSGAEAGPVANLGPIVLPYVLPYVLKDRFFTPRP